MPQTGLLEIIQYTAGWRWWCWWFGACRKSVCFLNQTTPVTNMEDDSSFLKYVQPTTLSGMWFVILRTWAVWAAFLFALSLLMLIVLLVSQAWSSATNFIATQVLNKTTGPLMQCMHSFCGFYLSSLWFTAVRFHYCLLHNVNIRLCNCNQLTHFLESRRIHAALHKKLIRYKNLSLSLTIQSCSPRCYTSASYLSLLEFLHYTNVIITRRIIKIDRFMPVQRNSQMC